MRRTGAVLAAGAATFGTTATIVGVTAGSAGATQLEVTNCNATGGGSLHDVVEGANTGDVVVFNTGGCNSITLNDDIDITKSVAVQGPGAGAFTVSGNNAVRIFTIDATTPPIDVTISGLTLTGGNASEGGAIGIFDTAHVTVADSVLTQNHSSNDGGGIHVEAKNTTLAVQNTTISGNTATAWGGAIYFYGLNGVVTISNSDLSGNTADDGGGATWLGGEGTSSVTITNTTVTGNTASANNGGGLAIWYADTTITGSTITGNTGDGRGGGLYSQDARSVNIDSSTISGNTAPDGGGGAFIYYTHGNVTISNSVISGNTTDGSGGGIYAWYIDGDLNITNTQITQNTAADGGGGVWAYTITGDTANITGSVISGNHTSDNDGGGLYFGDVDARTTIAFTTIANNSTSSDSANSGGGVNWFSNSGVLRVLNSTISGNTSGGQGGGLYIGFDNSDVAEIFNSTVSGNTSGGEGGGIALAGSYYGLTIAQATITGNTGAHVGGLAIYCFDKNEAQSRVSAKANAKAAGEHDANPRTGTAKARQVKAHQVHAHAYGDVSASGTIISGNTGVDVGACGHLTSDHSLIGTLVGTTFTDKGGTILGQLPLVAPLGDNGGPTQTHALLPDSPAINAGPVPVATFEGNENDQRGEGFPRVVGPAVDIGAFEVQPPKPAFTG